MKTYFNLSYTGANGRKSLFDLRLNEQQPSTTLVIFAHGYKGYKDWGAWNLVAEKFTDHGFDFLKFNFSHNGGTIDNPIDFPDLEAFSENNYSKELFDLRAITDLVCEKGVQTNSQRLKWESVNLIGHSRGGGIAILHAARDNRITKLATWASVANFGERFGFDMDAWKRDGITHVLNGRTKQEMPHKYSYYLDYIQHENELSIEKAARRLEIPWLIVHGTSDEAVDFENAERLKSWSQDSRLYPSAGIGHTFGAIHPWPKQKLPSALNKVCTETVEFFKK